MGDVEVVQQQVQFATGFVALESGYLEDGKDVFLDRELAEDRCFLRQVADAKPRPLVNGEMGGVGTVNPDFSCIGRNKPDDHVKAGGFAGTVGAEQTDHFTAFDIQGDILDHRAAFVAFLQVADLEMTVRQAHFVPCCCWRGWMVTVTRPLP